MATSAGNVTAVDGQLSWPAIVAAHATLPEAVAAISGTRELGLYRRTRCRYS